MKTGQWVRYTGPNPVFCNMVGQVVRDDDYTRGILYVRFRSRGGGTFDYGCYPQFLTGVGRAAKAHEIACRALSIPFNPTQQET